MARHGRRNQKGISLVELTCALVLGLPLIVAVLYATLEANFLFTIRTNLDVGARRAAQLLINDYVSSGTPSTDTTNGNLPSSMAFDVKTADGHYFINHSANQFTWTWDFSQRPATLTVAVTYPSSSSGTSGFVPFPNPDPLNLGQNFTILTSGTFPVPGIN